MDVAAFVIALLSAGIAVYAAWHAKRSADAAERTAAAEERAAAATEAALEIESERARHEHTARTRADAPVLDAGTGFWVLHDHEGLSGAVANSGPTSAVVEAVELENQNGSQDGTWDGFDDLLRPGDYLVVNVPWNAAPRGESMTLHVTYTRGNSGDRVLASFPLRRANSTADGEPMWKASDAHITWPSTD